MLVCRSLLSLSAIQSRLPRSLSSTPSINDITSTKLYCKPTFKTIFSLLTSRPLRFTSVLSFYVISNHHWTGGVRSPNGTQLNFAAWSKVGQIWNSRAKKLEVLSLKREAPKLPIFGWFSYDDGTSAQVRSYLWNKKTLETKGTFLNYTNGPLHLFSKISWTLAHKRLILHGYFSPTLRFLHYQRVDMT